MNQRRFRAHNLYKKGFGLRMENEDSQNSVYISRVYLSKDSYNTDRVDMKEIEMQGIVPAPLKCSVQLDSLEKECLQSGEGVFRYKECINIPPLAVVSFWIVGFD